MAITYFELTADLVRVVSSTEPDQTYIADWVDTKYQASPTRRAFMHFSFPAEYAHRKLNQYNFSLYCAGGQWKDDPLGAIFPNLLAEPFPENVTYNTKPGTASLGPTIINPEYFVSGYYKGEDIDLSNAKSGYTQSFIQNFGNGITAWGTRNFSTSTTDNPPKVTIWVADTDSLPTASGSPSGGYLPKQSDNRFTWTVAMPEGTYLGWDVSGQAFEWKYTDAAEWTHVDVSANEYTIPANTLTGDIVWRAVVTVTDGSRTETIYTSGYSINTTEPLGSATPVSPKNALMDGSRPITLTWRYYNSSGRQQNGADIQWGPPNSTYQDLASVTGNTLTYTVPADFFPAGTIYWRTRAYNLDGAVGAWSAGVTFTNRAAPPMPILTSDGVPYATLTWQSEGQEAWQLTVDGVDYGTRYGYDQSFTLPEPLEDGQHTASVIVQNEFGLWSQPGTLVFDVRNAGAGTLTLTGSFGTDAALTWSGDAYSGGPSPLSDWERGNIRPSNGTNISNGDRIRTVDGGIPASVEALQKSDSLALSLYCYGSDGYLGIWNGGGFATEDSRRGKLTDLRPIYMAGATKIRAVYRLASGTTPLDDGQTLLYLHAAETTEFQIYRDGVRIGHTTGDSYNDRMALGEHSWFVVRRLADGNYQKSNVVTGAITIEEPLIGTLNGSGEWLKLALSDRSATVQEFSSERTVNYRHYAGAEYPVLEMAPFKDKSGRYDVSFKDQAEAAAFEALFGQVVILKSRRGNVIVGPLATLSKRETDFYTSFSFTIQQIHWEEIVDDT